MAIGALALIVLAGCAAGAGATPSASPTPTATPTATAIATPSPTPTPTPTATAVEDMGTAVPLKCTEVLTPDDVYDFNPNYGTAPGYKPADGSAASVAAANKGVACGWLNQTSGDVVEVSITQPSAAVLADLKKQVSSSGTPAPGYEQTPSDTGYFEIVGGKGRAQVFTDKYWVVAASLEFREAIDAQALVAAAVSHLP